MAQRAKEAEEAGKNELQKAQERIAALEAEKQASILAAPRAELSAKRHESHTQASHAPASASAGVTRPPRRPAQLAQTVS